MKGYMLLNSELMDDVNGIQYEIGKSYKHDKNLSVFHVYFDILDAIISDDYINKNILVEISSSINLDRDESDGFLSDITIDNIVSQSDIILSLRSFLKAQDDMCKSVIASIKTMTSYTIDKLPKESESHTGKKQPTKKEIHDMKESLHKLIHKK